MKTLEGCARQLLSGCIVMSERGVPLYTPDGQGNYPALWTRDFAYMVEYAGDLIPAEHIRAGIEFLMAGQRQDGWIPDRVYRSGWPTYTAGDPKFPAKENLDNGPFLVILADEYLKKLPADAAKQQFAAWEAALCGGVDCLSADENGLIWNDPAAAHSPYGFTDCICKTGALAMESLLLWRSCKILEKRLGQAGLDAEKYAQWGQRIEAAFSDAFWSAQDGMLYAATGLCRQIDIWASCYAVAIGFPLAQGQKDAIARYLTEHYSGIVQKGQVRHLPAGEYWEKTFIPVERETYQNGGYWATAAGWLFEALVQQNPDLAYASIREVLADFRERGIFEWVNGDRANLHTYVAAVTNVYGVCRKYEIGE